MRGWVLVTGGVASGIGKGVAAAMIGRRLARTYGAVDYRKLEPCLQTAIEGLPNTAFGEIVHAPGGHWHDADVARAAFWIPGYLPDVASDVSLGRIVPQLPAGGAAPRLGERLAETLRALLRPVDRRVIEVGGTAGEPEHGILVRGLVRAFGPPALHAHVTTQVQVPGGRLSTKAAQVCIDSLMCPPDVVFVRGGGALDALRAHLGSLPLVTVAEDEWAERAWHVALAGVPMLSAADDPVLDAEDGSPIPIDVTTDVGLDAYDSLRARLFAWSGGRARIVRGGAPLRIGEAPPPRVAGAFSIVPVEVGGEARDPAHRPDWQGTADAPAGPLADWLRGLPSADREVAPPSPYTVPEWASIYIEQSRGGHLRDHGALAELLDRALPAPLTGRRVLDVGCGDGRLAARLVQGGATVVGVEPSAPMADAAEARGLSGFRLVRATAESFAVEGVFDLALAWMCLDHCAALDVALANIAASLRPGGRLIACTEHALRTAPRDGMRWGPDAARVRDYTTPGWRTFRWFGRPEPVPVHHIPVGAWVNAARAAGLTVAHLAEPADEADHGVPRFQLFVLERPDPSEHTITLDGPAGSGKSTLGRALAGRLAASSHAVHLDTGRLQRLLALRSLRGGQLTRDLVDSEVVWLLDGVDPGAMLEEPAVLARCSAVDDAEVLAELALFADRPRVISGRAWGRARPAQLRLWLDVSVELRAARRGVTVQELLERDDRDRARGRLLPPDLCAVVLDGRQSVEDLVEVVVRALGP